MNPTSVLLRVLGIYLLIDSSVSIGVRADELGADMGQRQWIETIARVVRGLIAVILILVS